MQGLSHVLERQLGRSLLRGCARHGRGGGCHVLGSHRPLIANPNESVKWHMRQKVYRTVIKAEGLHKWEVPFDFDGKSKVVSSRSLKCVPIHAGILLDEENTCSDSITISDTLSASANTVQCTAIVH